MAACLLSRAAASLRLLPSLPKGRVGWARAAAESNAGFGCRASLPPPLMGAGPFGIAARCNATSSSSAVSEAAGVHALPRTEPVVSAEWLHANLRDPDVKVLDASWYMPAEQRNPLQEYQVAHIPGALFFDVDGISDRTSSLPHMLPSEKAFSAAVSALDIYNKDGIVVYDGKGLFSAARVWWMFRVFGHDKVWVLDGGLPQWRASGYDVESSASTDAILKASAAREAIEKVYQGQSVGPITFEAKLQPHLLWNLDQVKENINTQTHQLIDARSKPRFDGAVPEPRKGIRSGHVPGSKCIPFPQVLDSSQKLLPPDELCKRFGQEGNPCKFPNTFSPLTMPSSSQVVYVIIASFLPILKVCTHLNCTPNLLGHFKCQCSLFLFIFLFSLMTGFKIHPAELGEPCQSWLACLQVQ